MKRRLSTVVLLSLFAAPLAFAEGPPPPPGWGKPRPKVKVEPKEGDLVSGSVKFKLGDRPLELKVIRGTLEAKQVPGAKDKIFIVLANWRDSEATEDNFLSKEGQQLQLMISTAKPGPLVNGLQVTMSYARDEQGVSKIVKASKCTFTVTRIDAKHFAGNGSCTAGLLDEYGKEGRPVTDIEFEGTAK